MKATMSRDGKRRATLKVEVRLDADMLATLVTSFEAPDEEPEAFVAKIMKGGERAMMETARKEILRSGDEVPAYRVGDNGHADHCDALAIAIRAKFGID